MKNQTNFAAIAACNPRAYEVAIAMHAHRMHERYRQERLRALGEKDDNPYDDTKVYHTVITQLCPEWWTKFSKEGK